MAKAKKPGTSTKRKGGATDKSPVAKAPAPVVRTKTKTSMASKAARERELPGTGAASSARAPQAQATAAVGSRIVPDTTNVGAKPGSGVKKCGSEVAQNDKKRKREKQKKKESGQSKPGRDNSHDRKKRKKEETEPAMPCYAPPTKSELEKNLVPLACQAFRDKLQTPKGKRDRRTKERPFQLLTSQAHTLSRRYQAARNQGIRVDYSTIAGKLNFETFAGRPEKLAAYEPWLLKEIEIAYKEITADKMVSSKIHIPDLTMELIRGKTHEDRETNGVEISNSLEADTEIEQAAHKLAGAKNSASTSPHSGVESQLEAKADPVQINNKLREELSQLQTKVAADIEKKDKAYRAELDQAKADHDAAMQQLQNEIASERCISSGFQKKLANLEIQLAAVTKEKAKESNLFDEALKAQKAKFQKQEAAQAEKAKLLEIREKEVSAKELAFDMNRQRLKSWSDELKEREKTLTCAEKTRRKNPDENEAVRAKLEKLKLEIDRQQRSLRQQLEWNGYSMQMQELATSRDHYANKSQILGEEVTILNTKLEDQTSELAECRENMNKLQLALDDRQIKLTSYVRSGVTEGRIMNFTDRHAKIEDGELSTLLQKRDFIVRKMQQADRRNVDQEDKLRTLIFSFWEQRNRLIHDKTGALVDQMKQRDHLKYQQQLSDIDEIMDGLETV